MIIERTLAVLDLNKLNTEAKNDNPKIEIVMLFGDDLLKFTVNDSWDTDDDTVLNDFLSSYVDANPQDKIPKMIDLAKAEAKGKHFHNIIYTSNKELISSLIPVRTMVHGEVTQVDWYRTLDVNQAPTDLILRVEISYTRDASGFALFRTTSRTYINRDGSDNEEVKHSQKFYFVNQSDMIDEGIKRRKLIVKNIQIPALTYMTQVLMPLGYTATAALLRGRSFMDLYETLFTKFETNSSTINDPADPNYGRKSIIVALEDNSALGFNKDHNEWLDKAPSGLGGETTIRNWLISEFDI